MLVAYCCVDLGSLVKMPCQLQSTIQVKLINCQKEFKFARFLELFLLWMCTFSGEWVQIWVCCNCTLLVLKKIYHVNPFRMFIYFLGLFSLMFFYFRSVVYLGVLEYVNNSMMVWHKLDWLPENHWLIGYGFYTVFCRFFVLKCTANKPFASCPVRGLTEVFEKYEIIIRSESSLDCIRKLCIV